LPTLETLTQFNLTDHGDRHERERWPLLLDRFPKYEEFWQLFIVPLTNRTCAEPLDSSWIRLRPDVPAEWEKLAVCHYSVFYYLSRAAKRRIECFGENANGPAHPEDVIYLLQTCCENVGDFHDALRAIANDAVSYLPLQRPKDFPFREINAYRNLLLHNPVLGRGELDGETLLPRLPEDLKEIDSWASKFTFSWRAVEQLDAQDLISARELLLGFEDGLAKYLNDEWTKLISDLRSRNLHGRFQQILKLPQSSAFQRSSRIDADSSCATLVQPLAASGTFNVLHVSEPGKRGRVP